MVELWRDVPGYETLYRISSTGEVFSKGRCIINKLGRKMRFRECKMKYSTDADGYFNVTLTGLDHTATQFRVSRLVAMTFISNPDNLPVVNHKDGNKQNNCVDNLEWCTVKYNTFHAYQTGLHTTYPPVAVLCLNTNQQFESYCAAARWVGCDPTNIKNSIESQSCCKHGYCFVRAADVPENIEEYMRAAESKYRHNCRTYVTATKCIDTGEVYDSIAACSAAIGKPAGYVQECITKHRELLGLVFARISDIQSKFWDEADYACWVHALHDANKSRDYDKLANLHEYGRKKNYE